MEFFALPSQPGGQPLNWCGPVLTYKAQGFGYHPEVRVAGRRLNDSIGAYVVAQLVKAMTKKRVQLEGAHTLVLGINFKESCPNVRNTKVVDIVKELADYNVQADVFDPWVDPAEAQHEYGITPISQPQAGAYGAVVVAVEHHQFKTLGADGLCALGKSNHVPYDL